LGINTKIISPGKFYYDPKHAAGFGPVAKLVKASKNNKNMLNNIFLVRIRTIYINL